MMVDGITENFPIEARLRKRDAGGGSLLFLSRLGFVTPESRTVRTPY